MAIRLFAALTINESAAVADASVAVLFHATTAETGPFVYTWEFGDGVTSASAAPSHAYAASGSFRIVLHLIDPNGSVTTAASSIEIHPAMMAYLPATISPVATVGAPVELSVDVSAGTPPYDFHWVFGDGTDSAEQNPGHAYTAAGSFVATVTITDAAGGVTQLSQPLLVEAPGGAANAPPPGSLTTLEFVAGLGVAAALAGALVWWIQGRPSRKSR